MNRKNFPSSINSLSMLSPCFLLLF
jgi:hypothetical protein